jgi:putative oxidoreductase
VKPDCNCNGAAVLRCLIGALLLWAAVSKLANPTDFLGSIYAYQLPLPRAWQQTAAVVLPWVELLCGVLLLINAWTDTALVMVTFLFVVFVLATGQAWARGLEISCGCFNLKIFGLNESAPGLVKFLESVAFAFFRNLALTALVAWLLRKKLNPPAHP